MSRWAPIVAAAACALGCSSGRTPSPSVDALPADASSEAAVGDAGSGEASASDASSGDDGAGSDGPVSSETGTGGNESGPAAAVLSSTALDLGSVSCGQSGTASLNINNTGSGDLAVSASITGQEFSLSPSTLSISPGHSGAFTVTGSVPATASAGSVLTETLILFTNDPAHATIDVPVTVTPFGAIVQFGPGSSKSASFPTTEPGFTAPPVTVSLLNSGNAPATVRIGLPSDAEFTMYGAGPSGVAASLAPGDNLTVIVAFKPNVATTSATASAPVTVTGTTCGNGVTSIAFSGAVGHGIVSRWPAILDFGNAQCGGAAPDYQYVVLGNAGTTNATITSATMSGAAGFTTNAKGLVIPAGLTASFAVFPPPVPSASTLDPVVATLTIVTDADSSPHAITLTEEPIGEQCLLDGGAEGGA